MRIPDGKSRGDRPTYTFTLDALIAAAIGAILLLAAAGYAGAQFEREVVAPESQTGDVLDRALVCFLKYPLSDDEGTFGFVNSGARSECLDELR